jgi:3'-phosphoadenosine 5'-phosphosulfate sulfotransferase (PAPS reductase)/FAD synthetase
MLGLAFSGGKDSLACWYLYKNQNPIVFWSNTGKTYPETLELVNKIKAEAAEFIEVITDQKGQIESFGLPSDIVPVDCTKEGMVVTGQKSVMVQSYLDCCYQNISKPLLDAAKQRGITQLVRGQRLDESHKSVAKHGSIVDGIAFIQPIETWTKDQVFAFLRTQGELPDHFAIEHSSLDCYDCTAYLKHSADRVAYTKEKHPKLYEEYKINMDRLKTAVLPIVQLIKDCNE